MALENGRETIVNSDTLTFAPELQMRAGGTNEERAEQIAEVLKAGGKIDRLSVMEVEEETETGRVISGRFVFDGFTRGLAYEKAGKSAIPITLYKGTWAECLRAAAHANMEHDSNGRPRKNADKVRALMLYAKSFEGLPKKEWPTNREAAKELAISYQMVNDHDPFGRGEDAKKEEGPTEIKSRAAAKKAKKKPKATQQTASGTVIFDWAAYESHIRYLVTGLDAISSANGLKKMVEGKPVPVPQLKHAEEHLEAFAKQVREWKEAFSKAAGEKPKEKAT